MNIIRFAFSAAIVLAGGTAATACAGGGSLSIEEYFQKVEATSNDGRQKEDAAQPTEEETANLTLEQQKQTGIDFLTSIAEINEDTIDEIDNLNPPDDVEGAHNRLVAEGRDLAKTFRDFAEEAKGTSPEGIGDFFNSQVFVESTFAPFDEACFALQKIADDKDISVNLNCAPEG